MIGVFEQLWSEPFWRGYFIGAALTLVLLLPTYIIMALENRSLKRELRDKNEKG